MQTKLESKTTTRELTECEVAKLKLAGITGKYFRVLAFNDRPEQAKPQS